MICAAIGLPAIVATSPSATAAQLVASAARRRVIQCPVCAGARWSIRHGRHCGHIELHDDDIDGPEGDR